MKDKVKRRFSCAVFIITFIALLSIISHIFMPKSNTEEAGIRDVHAHGILAEPSNTIDALFLGDSESYMSVIPIQMWKDHGIASYCSGTSNQKLSYTLKLFKLALTKQSPKVVLLETNAIYRPFGYDDLIRRNMSLVFPVFEFHNRWRNITKNDFREIPDFTTLDSCKGYIFSTKIMEADTNDYMKATASKAKVPFRAGLVVEEIKSICESHGAKLILYSAPSTVNWNMKRHNGITEFANKHHITYLDLNTIKGLI